jgi:hypothetical protein
MLGAGFLSPSHCIVECKKTFSILKDVKMPNPVSYGTSNLYSFPTRADVTQTPIPLTVQKIEVRGHTTEYVGSAIYKRLPTSPATVLPEHVQSAAPDAAWWEIDMDEINPFQFGAAGDKTTDDTSNLLAMAAYANKRYNTTTDTYYIGKVPTVTFETCEGFRISGTISLEIGLNVNMHCPIWVEALANAEFVALRAIDTYGSTHPNKSARWSEWSGIRIYRLTQSNWSKVNDIGLQIDSAYVCRITSKIIAGFRTGMKIGASYGKVDAGEIYGAKFGIVHKVVGSVAEFANSMEYTWQAISVGSDCPKESRYGMKIEGVAGAGINTIRLNGVLSWEGNLALAQAVDPQAESVALWIDGTNGGVGDVTADYFRTESNGGTVVKLTGTVRNTDVYFLHAEDTGEFPDIKLLDDQTGTSPLTAGSNNKVRRSGGVNSGAYREIWRSGPLAENAIGWGNNISVRGLHAMQHTVGAPTFKEYTTSANTDFDSNGYMQSYNGPFEVLTRRVDLNGERSLGMQITKRRGDNTNCIIKAYDKQGNSVTAARKIFIGLTPFFTQTFYGGSYGIGIAPVLPGVASEEVTVESQISFAAEIASLEIGFIRGTTSGIKEFTLLSPFGMATTFAITDKFGSSFFADAVPTPTTGLTYKVGMEVVNVTPGPTENFSWYYNTSGQWQAFGGSSTGFTAMTGTSLPGTLAAFTAGTALAASATLASTVTRVNSNELALQAIARKLRAHDAALFAAGIVKP